MSVLRVDVEPNLPLADAMNTKPLERIVVCKAPQLSVCPDLIFFPVKVSLKLLISDGTATAVGIFASENCQQIVTQSQTTLTSISTIDLPASPTPKSNRLGLDTSTIRHLSILMGLEETFMLQIVRHLAENTDTSAEEDPVRAGLDAWFASPGFQRPLMLTLREEQTAGGHWSLRKAMLGGGEVRLSIPPAKRMQILPF